MWPFRTRPRAPSARELWDAWFRPVVPDGHASLEAFEAAMTDEERARLPETLQKLAVHGVDRIHHVRGHDLEPTREGLVYLDRLLDDPLRWNLTRGQDPNDPRNLFRAVVTELGCIVGEIHVRVAGARWEPARAPNLWRSRIRTPGGDAYDPFFAVVRQLSRNRLPEELSSSLARATPHGPTS